MKQVKVWWNGELVADGRVAPMVFLGIIYLFRENEFSGGGEIDGMILGVVPSFDEIVAMKPDEVRGGRFGDNRGWVTFEVRS